MGLNFRNDTYLFKVRRLTPERSFFQRIFPPSPSLMDILSSFLTTSNLRFLDEKEAKIKAKTIGLPHGLPKRLTFKSGSACRQTQAPLRESQAFSSSFGQPPLRVLAVARAPNPDELWRAQCMLIIYNKAEQRRNI
jgi:hypothetical protein